jgi:class 3 adenylate cyclase
MGLASGELLSGSIGAQALGRLDYTVLGEVVNTAAWLASLAGKDELLIPEELSTRLDSSFECTPLGTRPRPGLGTPINVHAVACRREDVPSPADSTASAARSRDSDEAAMAALKASPDKES